MSKLSRKEKILATVALAVLLVFPVFAANNFFAKSQANPTYIIPMEDWVKNDDMAAIKLVNQLLELGVPVKWAQEPFTVGGATYPAGTFYIETPFTTNNNISSDVIIPWFLWEAKIHRVMRIDVTAETILANATELVLPRVIIFYDKSTYDNCLNHYEVLRSMGFKAVLAPADELWQNWWNGTEGVYSEGNVFVMPGGAIHLWSFPWGAPMSYGIGNISQFVAHGGGYIGVCAGASEALNKTPYTNLGLVDADYNRDWFDESLSPPGAGATEWKQLIGPMRFTIVNPNHPVMFGYGENAVRPGYGPEVAIYYYGGPTFLDIGANITILANYSGPISQQIPERVADIFGEPGIISAQYGEGRAVLFGPHPEWPGPGARMYAQALYYTAQKTVESPIEPGSVDFNPQIIEFSRVNTIINTIANIKPVLDSFTRVATEMVNLRAGDHYNPVGLWFDEVVQYYGMKMYEHINEIGRTAVKLQYEYFKLNALSQYVAGNPELINLIRYAQAMIVQFFNYSENFPSEPHYILDSDWTGNTFAPYPGDADNFTGLITLFEFVENETAEGLYPFVLDYATNYYKPYNELLRLNKTEPTRILDNQTLINMGLDPENYADQQVNESLVQLYNEIKAVWPTGPLYKSYYKFYHTLDVCQFKIDYHMLNLITLGDRAREVASYVEYTIASAVGSWAYALAEWNAALAQPGGLFT